MNTNSIPARIVPNMMQRCFDENDNYIPSPGDIDIPPSAVGMHVCCPGCGMSSLLTFGPEGTSTPQRQVWQLSGVPQYPTLKPSIHHVGCWHGHLTDGQFVSC